ncbi:hypothetical protein D3C80_1932620 [compost metagenome]
MDVEAGRGVGYHGDARKRFVNADQFFMCLADTVVVRVVEQAPALCPITTGGGQAD